jgi:hypothetical protein
MGYEIVRLEKEKHKLEEELRTLEIERAKLLSCASLLQLNQSLGLYLLPPEEWLNKK